MPCNVRTLWRRLVPVTYQLSGLGDCALCGLSSSSNASTDPTPARTTHTRLHTSSHHTRLTTRTRSTRTHGNLKMARETHKTSVGSLMAVASLPTEAASPGCCPRCMISARRTPWQFKQSWSVQKPRSLPAAHTRLSTLLAASVRPLPRPRTVRPLPRPRTVTPLSPRHSCAKPRLCRISCHPP